MASTVGGVQDLVVKDREVQRKTQADGVGRCELSLGNIGGRLCGGISCLLCSCEGVDCVIPCRPRARQSQQPCASHRKRTRLGNGGSHPSCAHVSLVECAYGRGHAHLVVKDLGLARLGLGNKGIIENVEDILADLLELCLDLLAVIADGADVLLGALGLLLLLNRGDDAPRRASCADNVLVGDGQKVALVHGQFTGNLQRVRGSQMLGARISGRLLLSHASEVSIPWQLPAR